MQEEEIDGIVDGDLVVGDAGDCDKRSIDGIVNFINSSCEVDSSFEAPRRGDGGQ